MNKTTQSHVKINLPKTVKKKKFLKVVQEKGHIMYRETKVRMTVDFSLETISVGTQWRTSIKNSVVPPYPWGICSKIPSGCPESQIIANPNQLLQFHQKCDSNFFIGKCSLSRNVYIFHSKPIPESA